MSRGCLNRSSPTEEGDIRGWETAPLCTCKQVRAEVLPVLMRVAQVKTIDHGLMMRLSELRPPHFHMLRDVEFVWLVSNQSFLGSQRKDDAKPIGVICRTNPERTKDTAIALRAICEALNMLEGLEVMKWHFHLLNGERRWAIDEVDILEEVNRARRGRQGWQVMVWSSLPRDSKAVEQDWDELTVTKLPR